MVNVMLLARGRWQAVKIISSSRELDQVTAIVTAHLNLHHPAGYTEQGKVLIRCDISRLSSPSADNSAD